MKGEKEKPKMFATRITPAQADKIKIVARVKGVPMADVVGLMVDAFQGTPAEDAAIRALVKADKESK